MPNLARLFRPYFGAIVCTVLMLTAGGIHSALNMPSGVYPEVTFPRVAVVAKAAGLSVANASVQMTIPLEQAVSTVIGVASIRSKTIRGGSELAIDFAPGTDMRRAEQMTWNRVSAVRSQLPADVELTIEQMTPSVFPIMSIVLTGGVNSSRLRDYAYFELAPQIRNVPDVLYANVTGGDLREIEVEARPADLLAAGLSAADLADRIGRVHRLQPVGRIERPPHAFQIIVNTQAATVRELEELVIATPANQPVRVKDVADVRVWHQDRLVSVGYRGRDAVVISVFRRLGGSTVDVSHHIREYLRAHHPPGNIQVRPVYDQARFVNAAVGNVRDAIVVGGIFSILILLGFLRSLRATVIATMAIPTTLAITFLFLRATGETLNLMSLGGLAVAIGLIIDDTVVVIENIARHLTGETHGSPVRAAAAVAPGSEAALTVPLTAAPRAVVDPVEAASGEITGAVIGSTLTTVLVFVPLAFIEGVYGQFFASLSLALAIAVLISMVISLTLVPVFAARYLAGSPMPPPGPLYHFLERVYERVLSLALRFHWLTLIGSLLAVGAGIVLITGYPDPRVRVEPGQAPQWLVTPIETGLMPGMDEGAFILDFWAPSGTPLTRTESLVQGVEQVLSRNPDVDGYVRKCGAENGIFATQTNRGDIEVVLRAAEDDPWSLVHKPVRPPLSRVEGELQELGRAAALERFGTRASEVQIREEGKRALAAKYRRRTVREVMTEVEDEVRELFSEGQLKIEVIQIMQDELNDLSGASKPIEVKLFGPDSAPLARMAEGVGERIEKEKNAAGIVEINTQVYGGNPDLSIQVDGPRAARIGSSAAEVERQLRVMYQGQVATQVRESAVRITDVRVRYPDLVRFGSGPFDPLAMMSQLILLPEGRAASPAGVTGLPASPLSGLARAVPLSAVARLARVHSEEESWRENMLPVHYVTAEIDEARSSLGAVVSRIQQWMKEVPMPVGVHWELGGHYLHQRDAFRSLLWVMVVAILLVFVMLAFQFRSVALPFLIFLTQPLSLVSGLLALWLTRVPLNVSSYMGAILLIGLDVKNGILLVEYIQQLRAEGMPLEAALREAGRTRFRPILMTSLAAILGLLPLAFGIGPGAQMQQPLAVMVIGGLLANMLFTRLVIPAGYLVLARWAEDGA